MRAHTPLLFFLRMDANISAAAPSAMAGVVAPPPTGMQETNEHLAFFFCTRSFFLPEK